MNLSVVSSFLIAASLSSSAEAKRAGSVSSIPNEPNGFVLIEENSYSELQKLSANFLLDAERNYMAGNFAEAAYDLNAAARVLRINALYGTEPFSSKNLLSAADRLGQIASQVQSKRIASLPLLRRELAQAMYYKAEHDRLLAMNAWTKRQLTKAGQDMRASIDAIEHASHWSGAEMIKGGNETFAEVRDISGRLIKGTGWTTAAVGKAINDLGLAVQRTGEKVIPDQGTSSAMTQPALAAPTPPNKNK
jgi:hypothetical protein